MTILDLECTARTKELLSNWPDGTQDRDPSLYFRRFPLNTSLTLSYGFSIDGNIDSALWKNIAQVEASNFRSTSNWQDHVQLLRVWGTQHTQTKEYRARHDQYPTELLAQE